MYCTIYLGFQGGKSHWWYRKLSKSVCVKYDILGLKSLKSKGFRMERKGSPFLLSLDCMCFFNTWFVLSLSPWSCLARCSCPGHRLSSGPLWTSELFTACMAPTSFPSRWHLFSGHLPFEEKKTQWKLIVCAHHNKNTWLCRCHLSQL